MKRFTKLAALLLALVMVFSVVGCKKAEEPVESQAPVESTDTAPEESTEPEPEVVAEPTTIVYATSTFGQKFSPFFYTTVYDGEVVSAFTGSLLAADRGGAVIYNGIAGETVNYNGTDYTYYGMGDVKVTENADGTVDYDLTMRDDIKFSDGTPADIDDVIFGIYVVADPTYDGQSTLYAAPIEGISEYYNSMKYKKDLIIEAGRDGESEYFTAEERDAFWAAFDVAGTKFAQEIVDYCVEAGYGTTVAECAESWAFGGLAADATALDFWNAIADAYGNVLGDIEAESAGSSIVELLAAELGDQAANFDSLVAVDSVDYISGIQKTGDYSMRVHCTEFQATTIYDMQLIVAPLHWYGDEAQYNYDAHQFGFPKGDLSLAKAKTMDPLGCGPYVYQGYENGVVTLKANEYYFLGKPVNDTLLMQESVDSDYVPGIITGTFDIAVPSINEDTLNAIKDGNSNGELVGDTVTTYLVDYRGYGYLGINANLVNVGGEGGSDASKALRKGFMTLFSVYRDTVINSYYGDRAAVIQYPISNTSWAAPQPADEGFAISYSKDVNGNPIYTEGMSEEQKYEAAKAAAIDYFKAAGYTFDDNGKVTAAPAGVPETFEVMIPGQGQQDHPAYGVAVAASNVLAEMGITLQVNDVGTAVWNNALEGNTAMMWAAAWQSSVDPDMYQVYHSRNANGQNTNSNHYQVMDTALDDLIIAGRKSSDTEFRKATYKNAMEIIMDWGVELPLYQRKDCTTVSTARVDVATVPADMTPYWEWNAELETLAAVQ